METETDLNEKILKITMAIRNEFPELSKYLDEMLDTIPDEKNPEISVGNLRAYYESIRTMLNKYYYAGIYKKLQQIPACN
jgi:tRNA U54 and U55 pseudouridine synthase Pus10